MSFALYIAKRYLRSKSSQNAVNIINFVTFLVTVIGSAALFIVLSAFTGLKTFSLQFSNYFDPDLKAIPIEGKFFSLSEADAKQLRELEDVHSFSREIEERVYLTYKEKSHFATIKGVDADFVNTSTIDSVLYFGDWHLNAYSGVMGLGVFNALGIPLNNYQNPLIVLAPKPGKGSINSEVFQSQPFNTLPLVISGVFSVEEKLDNTYLFSSLSEVQGLLEKDSLMVSSINFKIKKDANLAVAKNKIAHIFHNKVRVLSRRELNTTLHKMLNTENMATYLIFTLVLIIALFNVVGSIIMMILDKQQSLRTLFALGSTLGQLRSIFFMQGVLTTCFGGLVGVLIGALLVFLQQAFHLFMITPTLAYPVAFSTMNLFVVLGTIFILGTICSKIASSRINKRLLAIS